MRLNIEAMIVQSIGARSCIKNSNNARNISGSEHARAAIYWVVAERHAGWGRVAQAYVRPVNYTAVLWQAGEMRECAK